LTCLLMLLLLWLRHTGVLLFILVHLLHPCLGHLLSKRYASL
jgi:hypothetical protein